MKHAAFFRNLNLGRPNCPTRAQFEAAFVAAGAGFASSLLTNGRSEEHTSELQSL